MITTIIFDWGGVLTKGRWTKRLVCLFAERIKKTVEEIFDPIDNVVVKLDVGSITVEQATEEINKITELDLTTDEVYDIFGNAINPNSDTINLLSTLNKTYKLVMLSNNDEITTRTLRKDHKDLLDLFDKIYLSWEYKIRKPDEKFFNLPLRELNLKPGECVFIDDKQKNIDAAEKLGIKGILFEDTEQLKEDLKRLSIKTT